ncbi:MAG: hypothetical protein KY395_00480 [Actinobacteria bacterium]|nr:hypothetical protein [Actinomycetota bacterium]
MRAVRLENVPTQLFLESQDHQHDLIRELQLIEVGGRFDVSHTEISHELARLIADILTRYKDVRTVTRNQALAALERGEATVTLDVPVRDGMVKALTEWLALLDQADRLCADGELLLVAASPEVRQLRQWYVDELVARIPSAQQPAQA